MSWYDGMVMIHLVCAQQNMHQSLHLSHNIMRWLLLTGHQLVCALPFSPTVEVVDCLSEVYCFPNVRLSDIISC